MMKAISVAALMTGGLVDARYTEGECPEVEYMTEFDLRSYSGMWYEVVRDPENPYTIGAECVTKEFSDFHEKSQSVDLYFRGYYTFTGQYKGVDGTLYDCGNSDKRTCMATMQEGRVKAPFKIFHTDYENFEITYGCRPGYGGKYETFALATRDPNPSKEVLMMANEIINEKIPHYGLVTAAKDLHWTKQGGWCKYNWHYHKNDEAFL